jgi:hypothetical protein
VRVTVRRGGRVQRERVGSLDEALDLVEARGRELAREARAEPIDTKVLGRFEPAQQVVGRIELSRPRCGVDVHGDGSATAYTGRVRRRALEGDDAYAALRRALATLAT